MIIPLLFVAIAAASPQPVTLETVRASMVGKWRGSLDYRDYGENKWFGLPVDVTVRDGGDGVTQLRTADFDDGPKTGIVRITTISLFDPASSTEYSSSFRKSRVPELEKAHLALSDARDPTHWTLVATITGTDDNRPATLRETTVRDGASMVTLKEVDFSDDAKVEWLARNRTSLKLVPELLGQGPNGH